MRGRYLASAVVAVFVFAGFARAEERSVALNGVTINYHDEGKGEAVVLLHGFAGSAGEMWKGGTEFLPALTKDYRVIAPDLRGHGKSDKPHDPKKYGAEVAEDVVRLLDHLKVKKAFVVGYSMGAIVAGKLLAAHPDRLLGVVFGGGGPLFQTPKEFEAVIAATADSLEKGQGVGPLVIALTPDGQPKPSPEEAAAISKLYLGGKDQKALAAVLRGQSGLEVTAEQLKANKVPVAFVYGSREVEGLKALATAGQKLMPKAAVNVVEKGDHISTAASPEFRRHVLEFLRANRP